MKVAEEEFYANIQKWLAKSKDEQIIVVNEAGKTVVVVGMGDQTLPDPEPFDFELDTPHEKVDTTHNPWLD